MSVCGGASASAGTGCVGRALEERQEGAVHAPGANKGTMGGSGMGRWGEGVQDSKVVGIRSPNPNPNQKIVCLLVISLSNYRKNNLLIVVFMLRSDINIL